MQPSIKLSKRRISKYIILILISYLFGLILFFPAKKAESLLYGLAKEKIHWQIFDFSWSAIQLKNAAFVSNGIAQEPIAQRLVVKPRFIKTLMGNPSAFITAYFEFGTVEIIAELNKNMCSLDINSDQADLAEIIKAIKIFKIKESFDGKIDFQGRAMFDHTSNRLEPGEWRAELSNFSGLGVFMDKITAESTNADNKMKVKVQSSGDILLQGIVYITPALQNLKKSPISGSLDLRINNSGNKSALQIFAGAMVRQLRLGGTIENPNFSL